MKGHVTLYDAAARVTQSGLVFLPPLPRPRPEAPRAERRTHGRAALFQPRPVPLARGQQDTAARRVAPVQRHLPAQTDNNNNTTPHNLPVTAPGLAPPLSLVPRAPPLPRDLIEPRPRPYLQATPLP